MDMKANKWNCEQMEKCDRVEQINQRKGNFKDNAYFPILYFLKVFSLKQLKTYTNFSIMERKMF